MGSPFGAVVMCMGLESKFLNGYVQMLVAALAQVVIFVYSLPAIWVVVMFHFELNVLTCANLFFVIITSNCYFQLRQWVAFHGAQFCTYLQQTQLDRLYKPSRGNHG